MQKPTASGAQEAAALFKEQGRIERLTRIRDLVFGSLDGLIVPLGVISGVASFGFWVETVAHKCEGLVSINSLLEYDDFRHNESDYSLVGRRSGRQFRMRDKVTIKVVSANLAKRQLDYEWVIATSEKQENVPGEKMTLAESETPGAAPSHLKGKKGGKSKEGKEKDKEKKHRKKKK